MLQLKYINENIRNYIPKDYAGNTPEGEIKVDCSLGVNSDLLGDCIFQRLHQTVPAYLLLLPSQLQIFLSLSKKLPCRTATMSP